MRFVIGLSVLVLGFQVAVVRADENKEQKISVSECPKAVQKTLKREVGKGKIVDVDVRQVDGVGVYESEIWVGDREYDVVIREDGTLIAKLLESDAEEDESDEAESDEGKAVTPVQMSELPRVVRRTLRRESRGGEVEEIEKEHEGDTVVYEAEVTFDGKAYEIDIAADGTLLCKMLEDDADEDEGDDEDEDEPKTRTMKTETMKTGR